MNQKLVKKINKATKKHGKEYLQEIKGWRFIERWRYCWYILFGDKRAVE